MNMSARTLVRVLLTVAGGVMVILGLLTFSYGVVWIDNGMFALFDGPSCVALGLLAAVSGIVVLVLARRRVRASQL